MRGLLTQNEILAWFGAAPDDISPNFLLFTQILTDTAFAFLPALVAWSAFRVFGGSPVLGIVLGLMLVNPALPNAYAVADGSAPLHMFGFIPVVGYQGSVLPAFFVGLIGAKFEKVFAQTCARSAGFDSHSIYYANGYDHAWTIRHRSGISLA